MGKIGFLGLAGVTLLGICIGGCGDSSDPDATGPGSGGSTGATTTDSAASTASGEGGSGSVGSTGGTGAGSSTSTTTGGAGGEASFEGYARVDTAAGTAVKGGADLAIAPDGTVFVTWVSEQGEAREVFIARSTDGGETFGDAVQVDDATIEPLVSMARHPYVATDGERVAVTFNDEGGTVRLYVSPASELAFESAVVVGDDITTEFRDFPKPLFLADGSIDIFWQGYPDSGARIFVSREAVDFATEEASGGAPGVPCECCPLDAVQVGDGALVAFRNNDDNQREMWSALAPSGESFSSWAAISTSEGTVPTCPMQGPRLVQIGDGSYLAVWSTRGEGIGGAAYVATSNDGGGSWSGGTAIPGFQADEPTIAVAASGRVFVTGVTGSNSSSMVWSDDGGATFSAVEALAAPDGAIAVPQAEGGAGMAALVGVSEAGSVWLRRME